MPHHSLPCRVRRALDLKSSASTLPQNALAAMHGHCGMLGSTLAPLGPWQAALTGPLVPGLHSSLASAAAHSRLGVAGLARAAPAKRSLSPIAEHSDMSPVAVRSTRHACCGLLWWCTGSIFINQQLDCCPWRGHMHGRWQSCSCCYIPTATAALQVRTRAARRMAPCADGAASCFAALNLGDKP